MDQVSNLVYNALAKRQGVVLPGIGTLYAVTVPAEMQKPGVVTPPVNRVELVTDELPGIPHIVDLIAGYDQTDPEQAREIYNRWLAENCSEEGVTIGAVGNIREGVFTPDPGLEEALNPVDTGAVRLPGRIDAKRVAMWVVFAVLIGVGISVGAIVWYEYSEQMRIVRLSEQPVLPASVPAAPDSPAVKVPAAAGSDSSAGESGAPAGACETARTGARAGDRSCGKISSCDCCNALLRDRGYLQHGSECREVHRVGQKEKRSTGICENPDAERKDSGFRFRGYGRNRGESDEERGVRPVPGCVGFQIQIRTIASGAKTKTACSFRKEQAVFVLASGVYSPK